MRKLFALLILLLLLVLQLKQALDFSKKLNFFKLKLA